MKWLVDKADTSDMTVRFKSRRKSDKEVEYKIALNKNFRDYIKEEEFKAMRFGYETVNNQTVIGLGLFKDNQGFNLISNKGDVRSWFNATNYIEQYLEEGIEVNFLKEYRVNLKKNGTCLLELVEE